MTTVDRPGEPDWVHGHAHEPNLEPPAGDGGFTVYTSGGDSFSCTVDHLRNLPFMEITDCFIVSTGHGTSGPFVFGGVRLADLAARHGPAQTWQYVDIVSADGFGARLSPDDVQGAPADRPVLLAYWLDGAPLTRAHGLVRLVVPAETGDALRQVKWIDRIEFVV